MKVLLSLSLLLFLLLPHQTTTRKTKEQKRKELEELMWDHGEPPAWYTREKKVELEIQLDREHGLLTLPPLEREKVRYSDSEFSLVFLHVPKSGGLALRQVLRRLTYPTRLVYRPTWENFLKSPCEKKHTSFFSSLTGGEGTCVEPTIVLGTDDLGACKSLNKTQCVYVTILRNPIDVCFSHYEYFCQRGKEGKKLWEWAWKSCGMTVQEWAKKHCQNLLVDTLSINFHNLFTRGTFTPKELEKAKAKFNIREKIEVAKSNLRNIYVMNYQNGLDIEFSRFLRHIRYPGTPPKMKRVNHHNKTEELKDQIKVDRNDPQSRQDLEEILWADMQVYDQYLGEKAYHLETFAFISKASSPLSPCFLLFSLLFLSISFSFS